MARRSAPEVNAGSMADIAFLLLIFFLVTTTMEKDKGIARQLPPIQEDNIIPPKIKEKNLFIVLVNKNNDIMVNEVPMELRNLRKSAIDFLDNGGASSNSPEYCSYCKGNRKPSSSDNPNKAVISVQNDRLTTYNTYIAVQNELVAAYNFLRNRESQRLYGWDYTEAKKDMGLGRYKGKAKDKINKKLKEIQQMYPLKLSEAQAKKQVAN
ncbi:MAG: biopolymer transporter ExbD [Flavobacteriaceae bacterium]|nr:biopolymer transporter ExbD [Flavobacteriaceae bacterium]